MNRLVDPLVLQPLLSQFSVLYPRANRAAIISQWSMNYMSRVLPATLACVLTRDCAIDFFTGRDALLHQQGQPEGIAVATPLRPLSCEARDAYWSQLLLEHFAPLFITLGAAGGLAPKVLWGNLVAIWDGAFERLDPERSRQGFAQAHAWLDQVAVNDGRLKLRPLQRRVASPVPEICASLPLRRHCCLHYQLHDEVPGKPLVLCESCPKLHRLPVQEQISYLRSIYNDG